MILKSRSLSYLIGLDNYCQNQKVWVMWIPKVLGWYELLTIGVSRRRIGIIKGKCCKHCEGMHDWISSQWVLYFVDHMVSKKGTFRDQHQM